MCLYIRSRKPRIAESNITVFKLVSKDAEKNCYHPIYAEIEKEYRLGETAYPSDEFWGKHNDFQIIENVCANKSRELSVYGGAIHSSNNLFDAICQYNPFSSVDYFAVLKCFIKKGTKYFCDEERKFYASEKLFIADEVENLGQVIRFMFTGSFQPKITVYSKENVDGETKYFLTTFYEHGSKEKIEIDCLG